MPIEFGLLGVVRARVEDRAIDLGPARQRCVLAALLVDVNQVVSLDQLVYRVWGEDPPPTAAGTLRSYLSRLRAALPTECGIHRRSGGYVLETDAEAVDLHRFRRLLAQVRPGDDSAAAGLYEQALGLWRGEAFADLNSLWLTTVRRTLEVERLAATLDYHDVRLRRGDHTALLVDLDPLADAHPLDERLAGQLMLAKYRSGRQAAALDHYERLRLRLADELGADPSPALQGLHQQILSADPGLAPVDGAAARRVPVPQHLPMSPRRFIGRARELAALDRALEVRHHTERAVSIAAISGSGGIGKSWLALHWAYRNMNKFPDGQLYVNLRGFDPSDEPMPPGVAIRAFLDALAVDPAAVPVDLDAQAALYRGLVTDKRMLIVLDNARDTAQVLPLLPGGSSCAVVVASRHQLAGLVAGHGAYPVALDMLDEAEARALLTGHLGADTVAAEPEAVTELLRHCAGLPLALGIVVARATMRPDFPLAALAEELREDSARLNALDAGELTANLRAVFSWSYRILTPAAAGMFRLLGIHCGPGIARTAVASLIGTTVEEVRNPLAELTRANLVIEHAPGRFTLHDLLRTYAAEQADTLDTETDRRAATRRLLDHYLHTAHAAALLLYPHRNPIALSEPHSGVIPAELTDHQQAMAWFTTEHPVLIAAIRLAADTGHATHTWQLAWTMVDFLDRQGHWHDLLDTQRLALRAATSQADLTGQAAVHRAHVRADVRLGRYDDARTHLYAALTLFAELGDSRGLAQAHHGLGWVLGLLGRHHDALAHLQQSYDLHKANGHRAGLALALNTMGWCRNLLGNYRQAVIDCQGSLALHLELGDRHGQATAWDSLGHAHHHLDNHVQAAACYEHALELYREVTDRYGEAETLTHLGDTHHAAGDTPTARSTWQHALNILAQLDHPDADQVRTKLHDTQFQPR
jgi:DNA-binding SARP family transcriptional activator